MSVETDDIMRMMAGLLDESSTSNARYAKHALEMMSLMESHNNLTRELLKEMQAQRRDTAAWWVIAMLVIMGSFWSYM